MEWLFTKTPMRLLDIKTPGAGYRIIVLMVVAVSMWTWILLH